MRSKWEEIAQSIQYEIECGGLSAGDRLPTEKELAALWSVARMTVHRAMDDLQRRGLVVRKRRLGTVVAEPAPAKRSVVGMLFFHTNDFPQADYIHGIRSALPDAVHLLFCDTGNDAAREADYLDQMRSLADAIICYPTCAPRNTAQMNRIIRSGFPLVCVDRIPEGVCGDAVVTDNYGSSHRALRTLQQQGHRHIALFCYDEMEVSSARERYEAYCRAMADSGSEDASPWVRKLPRGAGYDLAKMTGIVHDALFTLLRQPQPATAVFCEDDYILAAVLEACHRLGLYPPHDLSILSFNDCPAFIPRLTNGVDRLAQQTQVMGRIAAERLQRRMAGETFPNEVLSVPALFYPAVEKSRPAASHVVLSRSAEIAAY
jgi:GntR family transcriptional regulator of arabinose operon